MVKRDYVPDRGDLVWLAFDPQAGREQAGRRPAPVLSPAIYNERSGLAVVCPVTSRSKGYPFEVHLPQEQKVSGVVLADHLKSTDWRARGAEFAGKAPDLVLVDISAKLRALLSL